MTIWNQCHWHFLILTNSNLRAPLVQTNQDLVIIWALQVTNHQRQLSMLTIVNKILKKTKPNLWSTFFRKWRWRQIWVKMKNTQKMLKTWKHISKTRNSIKDHLTTRSCQTIKLVHPRNRMIASIRPGMPNRQRWSIHIRMHRRRTKYPSNLVLRSFLRVWMAWTHLVSFHRPRSPRTAMSS